VNETTTPNDTVIRGYHISHGITPPKKRFVSVDRTNEINRHSSKKAGRKKTGQILNTENGIQKRTVETTVSPVLEHQQFVKCDFEGE
jgi:hypothetical protein